MKIRDLWNRLLRRTQQADGTEKRDGSEVIEVSPACETIVATATCPANETLIGAAGYPAEMMSQFSAFGSVQESAPPQTAVPASVERRQLVTLTAAAVDRAQYLLHWGAPPYLRIEVQRQGQAVWGRVVGDQRLDPERDIVDDSQGVNVVVDRDGAGYVAGATVDVGLVRGGSFVYTLDHRQNRTAARGGAPVPRQTDTAPSEFASPARGEPPRQHPVADISKVVGDDRLQRSDASTMSEAEFLDVCRTYSLSGIGSLEDLAIRERIRELASQRYELGRAVAVDIFLWRPGRPDRPCLTKAGGVPHRERSRLWPTANDGTPLTFVAQFCFIDSKDIIPIPTPAEVMLVFMKDADAGDEDLRIEWSSLELLDPMTSAEDLPCAFKLPELAGVIYRRLEYPESCYLAEKGGFDSGLFPTMPTQTTKIGQEAFYIQGDPRGEGQKLLCVLDNFGEDLPLGDDGCIYFLIDSAGKVTWLSDCY